MCSLAVDDVVFVFIDIVDVGYVYVLLGKYIVMSYVCANRTFCWRLVEFMLCMIELPRICVDDCGNFL